MTDNVDKEAYKEVLSSLSLTLTDINRDSKPAYGTTATKSLKKKAKLSMWPLLHNSFRPSQT
jgi:hypothetical protein